VGIEVVGLFTGGLIFHLDEVGGIHRVPLSVDEPREDGAFVTPLGEILYGSRPHTDIGATIGGVIHIVRADDIGAQLTGVVGILEYTGLTIGYMLPQREVRVLGTDTECSTHNETENN
jgi:hypothetical protein